MAKQSLDCLITPSRRLINKMERGKGELGSKDKVVNCHSNDLIFQVSRKGERKVNS